MQLFEGVHLDSRRLQKSLRPCLTGCPTAENVFERCFFALDKMVPGVAGYSPMHGDV